MYYFCTSVHLGVFLGGKSSVTAVRCEETGHSPAGWKDTVGTGSLFSIHPPTAPSLPVVSMVNYDKDSAPFWAEKNPPGSLHQSLRCWFIRQNTQSQLPGLLPGGKNEAFWWRKWRVKCRSLEEIVVSDRWSLEKMERDGTLMWTVPSSVAPPQS